MNKAGHNSSHERRDVMREETRNKIRGKISEKGLSISMFADQIGMVKNTFSRKINGGADFTWDEVERMINALDLKDDLTELHRIFF